MSEISVWYKMLSSHHTWNPSPDLLIQTCQYRASTSYLSYQFSPKLLIHLGYKFLHDVPVKTYTMSLHLSHDLSWATSAHQCHRFSPGLPVVNWATNTDPSYQCTLELLELWILTWATSSHLHNEFVPEPQNQTWSKTHHLFRRSFRYFMTRAP